MDGKRRAILKSAGERRCSACSSRRGGSSPETRAAQAWNKAAFDTQTLDDTMKALGGGEPAQSKDIAFFQTPDIAENGAVVPIGITSSDPEDRVDRDPDREESEHAGGDVRHSGRAPTRRSRRA